MTDARTLLVTERVIAPEGRAAYLASLAGVRARCMAAGAQFWAFEQVAEPGRFLEFAEARQAAVLDGLALDDAGSLRWRSVELD